MRQTVGQSKIRLYVVAAVALVVAGVCVVAFRDATIPGVLPFLPALLLVTALCEVANVVVAALLLVRTASRAYLALVLTFAIGALLKFAVFLTLPLGEADPSLAPLETAAAPWLHLFWSATLAAGAVWYMFERFDDSRMSPYTARRVLVVVLPAFGVLSIGMIALIIHVAPSLPLLVDGTDTSEYRSSGAGFVGVVMVAAATAALAGLLRRGKRRRVDLTLTLALLAVTIGAVVMAVSDERIALPWAAWRLFEFAAMVILVVQLSRQLAERLGEGMRVEAKMLRAEASTFEQNAAVEASLVKSRFVATVSHELRTPLGGILGMAELLERTHLTEQQRMHTSAIRSSAESLLRIVNDLLDFSRVEAGMLELEDVPFDLVQLVEDVIVLFREQARERAVSLHAFIDPRLPRSISGDPTRIKQVLQNLVNNAVRFTQAGSIRVDVSSERWAAGAPMLAFSVRDSGIGIAPHALDRIFEAFTQADASTARRFGGTGLGLAIARHLVERMGGRITVRSTAGVGSTFTFTVPLRTERDASDRCMPLRDMRILIVESDHSIRDLLQHYVAAWEMVAQTVASCDEARALAASHADGDRACAILLVGPSIAVNEATQLAGDARSMEMLRSADRIYVRSDDHIGGECPPPFDACVFGPLRQSTLFDTIARLRPGHLIEQPKPAIDGVAARRPRRERILVAEDNEINQMLLVAQLEHLGFQADVVGDGLAAVDATNARRFDLIFMDCQMPGVDGFEAARRIRSGGAACADVPIIAVTANVLPGYRDVCIAAGMNDYLTKPALIEPLTRIVDQWLPLTGVAPPVVVPNEVVAPPHDALRRRLREIFRGDDVRVEATITLALTSLRDGTQNVKSALDMRDASAAARIAHKLKGVAMEIGLVEIAETARQLESAIGASDWDAAANALDRFANSIAAESEHTESPAR